MMLTEAIGTVRTDKKTICRLGDGAAPMPVELSREEDTAGMLSYFNEFIASA